MHNCDQKNKKCKLDFDMKSLHTDWNVFDKESMKYYVTMHEDVINVSLRTHFLYKFIVFQITSNRHFLRFGSHNKNDYKNIVNYQPIFCMVNSIEILTFLFQYFNHFKWLFEIALTKLPLLSKVLICVCKDTLTIFKVDI